MEQHSARTRVLKSQAACIDAEQAKGSAVNVTNALQTQESFTREQVAWLMNEAYRWGYEAREDADRGFWAGYNARVAEENGEWTRQAILAGGRRIPAVNRKIRRDEWYAAAHLPRPGDHRGGPVAWDSDEQRAVA